MQVLYYNAYSIISTTILQHFNIESLHSICYTQYLNQHARQLGLEAPTFASPKEKQNNSNKIEKQKLSSSDRKKNRTDRSDKKRKRTDAFDFKTKSRGNSSDKKDKRKVPFGKHCRRPSCKQRVSHKIIQTTNVVSRIAIRLRRITSILTWAKLQARTRITNPRVM